jgi:hypothetical protein
MNQSPQIEQLNKALQDRLRHRQVNVLVDQDEDRLNVLLIKLPGASVSYPGLMEAIKSQITMCKVPNIAQVKVLGLLQGRKLPEWEQTFPMVAIADTPAIQEIPEIKVETEPEAPKPEQKPELRPLETPEATPTVLPRSSQRRGSRIWSMGLGVALGIATALAIGYGLGRLNHGTSSDRPSDRQEQNSSQTNSPK